MIRIISLAAILLCISACASSGPEAPASAGANTVASDTASAPPQGEGGEQYEAQVQVTANAAAATDSDELICRKERQTGSRIATKVCRTRAEVEAREAKDQDRMREMRSRTSGSECAMQGGC